MSDVLNTEAGQVTVAGADLSVVFRRRYAQPIAKVWAAITTPERLADWLARVRYEPKAGGALHVEWENGHSMDGRVVTFDAPTTFAWIWPLYGRDSLVKFELEADGDAGCWLTLTHSGIDPTPGNGGGVRAGWHAHLDGLDASMEGVKTSWDTIMQRNAALQPLYPPLA